LFDRFAEILAPGGYLVIGHSESMYKLSDRFASIGNTVYRKVK
jgi:chemotaxis protein methyltransferase CheR